MKQLLMRINNLDTRELHVRELKQGFHYELFKGSEEEINDWLEICSHGLNNTKDRSNWTNAIVNYRDVVPEKDVFFVVKDDGTRVASTASVKHGEVEGYVHMVAALTSERNQGIGHAMLYHTLEELRSRGCTFATLTTDDFRLPAIKNYLDAGFQPVLWDDPESDMKKRWDDVLKELKYGKAVEYLPYEE